MSAGAQDAADQAPAAAPTEEAAAQTEAAPEEAGSASESAQSTPAEAPTLPAPEDEENPLVIHGVTFTPYVQVRPRLELRGNDPNVAPDVGFLVTNRARFGVKAQWESLDVHIQMQDVRHWGDAPPLPNDNGGFFGLHQGYATLSGDPGFIRVGRQEVNYGDQRMIGALNWASAGRAFDALRLHGDFADGKLHIDSFGAITGSQRLTGDNGNYLGTLYVTYNHSEALNLDFYLLYRHDGPDIAVAPGRDNNILAYGLRLDGDWRGLGYTTEITVEYGSTSAPPSADFFAWAASGDISYGFDNGWHPNLRAGFAIASGNDGDTNEFNNFFPTNHKFYGINDLFGLRNLIEGHLRFTATAPDSPVRFYAEVLQFGLQTANGRWTEATGAGGRVIWDPATSPVAPGTTRNLGTEIDAVAAWNIMDGLTLSGGYGAFLPQDGAEARGVDEVVHFGYVMFDVKTP